MPTKKIGVIGCGWLGKPLFLSLSEDFEVECFSRETTTDDSAFWKNDSIIIAINTKDNYLQTLEKIAKLSTCKTNIILMSSISVYREFDTEIDERAVITKKALQKEAEELMQSLRDRLVILRLGGLMGYDRVAGRWKKVSTFSDGEVNYIHRDDVVNITKQIIQNDIQGGIFNLVAPQHPLRSEVHKKNAKKFGLTLGVFDGRTNRIVTCKNMQDRLNYEFLYPNPLEFWD